MWCVCLFSKQKMEFKGEPKTTATFLMVISVCIPLERLNMVYYACSLITDLQEGREFYFNCFETVWYNLFCIGIYLQEVLAIFTPCALRVAKIGERHFIHPFSYFFCQVLFEMRNFHYFLKTNSGWLFIWYVDCFLQLLGGVACPVLLSQQKLGKQFLC